MTRNQHNGITLIETVVTVVTCGLIVTIFAPALKTARDQSQVATCLQNLRTLGQAANGYIVENGTFVFTFPFGYRPDTAGGDFQGFHMATEFIWGGGLPDAYRSEWNPEWGACPATESVSPDVYVLLESERPLNQYLTPGVAWCDPTRRGVSNPHRWQRPMQLPDFFKCPADSTCEVPMSGANPNVPQDPSWEWWGTSYATNWYWAYFYEGAHDVIDNLTGPTHRQLLADKLERGASEWVLFMENQMNFELEAAMPGRSLPGSDPRRVTGWHGQTEKHAAAFLDGSARYQYFNTAQIDDPGWTMWPNRPWDGTVWESVQNE